MPLRIDPAARPFTALTAIPTAAAALARAPRTTAALGLLTAGVTLFFRDPDRTPDRAPADPHDILSPADGIVMHVGEPQPGAAPAGQWQQVTIFLSVFDVHINRMPFGGRITEVSFTPGRYLAAYRAESATKNERSEIRVEADVDGVTRTVVFRQLVGQLARRVVTRVGVGDQRATGERMGLMKFGSRMDVFVPLDVVLAVTKRQRVIGGETVLGRFPGPSAATETALA